MMQLSRDKIALNPVEKQRSISAFLHKSVHNFITFGTCLDSLVITYGTSLGWPKTLGILGAEDVRIAGI